MIRARHLGLALLLNLCQASALADTTDGWFDGIESTFYLGVGKATQQTLVPGLENELDQGLLFLFTGDVRWGKFFLETPIHRTGTNINMTAIGYRFYQQHVHSWDVIASNYNTWLPDNKTSSASPQLAGLHIRKGDSVHAIRYQYQSQQHLLGVELGVDVLSHRGAIGRFSYSYVFPWRNLDFYLNAALSFESEKVVNYYYGVHPDEVRSDRPLYNAGAGVKAHMGITAIYPLAPKWQLDASLGVNLFSASYLDSPLVSRSHEQLVIVMVRYVF